jgi:hypothetical protein
MSTGPIPEAKFHPKLGLCYYDFEKNDWKRDEKTGEPIVVPRPDRPQRPQVRVTTMARKVQNWNAHETGSSVTLNTVDNVTG